MKVVVGLSAVLPLTGWPLLMGPWLLNSYLLTAFTAGDQTKMDSSFPSCTTEHVHQQRQNGSFRDGLQRSNRVWICCCSLMKSWLIMFFLHKICTRPIGRLVSQFYSSLGCFYPFGTTGRVVSSNTGNLVYTFSRWHDMSSLSCITIGSLWPSLQPKVGQTYFLQSWSHKSR